MPKPEQKRRAGEEGYEDPREQSLMKRLGKIEIPGGQVSDILIRIVVVLLAGGGAGFVANEHANANDAVAYEQLTALRGDFDKFRQAYYERQRERSSSSQKEREEVLQRLATIEAKIDMMRGRR
jgi:hypothetical protein